MRTLHVQGNNPKVYDKENLSEALFSAAPAGGLLRIRRTDGSTVHFHGFNKDSEDQVLSALADKLGLPAKKEAMSLAGHNWGQLAVHGSSLAFQVLLSKPGVLQSACAVCCILQALTMATHCTVAQGAMRCSHVPPARLLRYQSRWCRSLPAAAIHPSGFGACECMHWRPTLCGCQQHAMLQPSIAADGSADYTHPRVIALDANHAHAD